MNFEQEILKVLTLAGPKGLKAEKIARHVYNACNSIFSPLDYKEVHSYVLLYLGKNSRLASSVVRKVQGHGVYALDFSAPRAKQMLLNFAEHEDEKPEVSLKNEDQSLSLF